ncbi:ComEC/Rec2 family competence protein [Pseudomonas fluorescens]|uniref:MBL fold metallo-hydrolase n=1 Tax=Pseudomonas fluorescens TaxID=294 RepID=A0A944DLB3_PSEFL|nr:MBL fold metallo-hydrolase [Pseudomonas fluorescens]MBT2298494.1 MBL fold metallo-hydrolase [Pseudomonas fluorescens]MBT2310019.1 MBL fold metallo-hydrolase [Pseudomonas fluorescens]MBT2311043.1 MBL fold metallo-hydrolase [Pseudomonas fluorescens]MBT2320022.1 MBL fold metallo-hydrolase [Pseudomonas fluorescens]MBT2328950.1 MBL fold metallo-hydrolase [Pseudomonas fluorescens]
MVNGIEIDFLPVGEGKHSGDAIAVRWREDDQYKILIYDGGTKAYGADLVEHVKKHFNSHYVDYVVNSHPDNDHAGGLLHVLENLTVGQLWMHRPWAYSNEIRHYFHDGRITNDSLAERLKQKMSAANALEKAALERDIPIHEPFAGSQIGIFTVLSPTRDHYVHGLVPQFEKSPELKKEESTAASFFDMIKEAAGYVADLWDKEYLPDTVTTSAENESSAILFATVGKGGYLLTGDAGIEALHACADFASSIGIDLPQRVSFVQIPHHGGRHNVSTETLNMIVGEPLQNTPDQPSRTAYVSAAANAPRHPKKVVTNAFLRRGFRVGQTKGRAISHFTQGTPKREGWGPITYLPFYEEVEE